MKKIITHVLIVLSLLFTLSEVHAGETIQDFPSEKLRHGYSYNFYDVVNAQSKYVYVSDYIGSTFVENNGNYNGKINPTFYLTDSLVAKNKTVDPYTSEIAFAAGSSYEIINTPAVRKDDNLFIKYQMQYYTWEGTAWSGVKTHIENQPYEITWCGDGIRDDYIDKYSSQAIYESCDPKDTSESGWGTGGCSNSCQPVELEPVCNSLTYSTTKNPIKIGTDDTSKTVSCTVTNAKTIKIDCGNGDTQAFIDDGKGENTVTKSCTYTTAGTYTPKCLVDDTITNNQCQKTLTVTNPTPDIEIIKTDFNTADEDGKVENDTQTVIKGNKALFKITVKNIGGESLKKVAITDAVENSCNRISSQTEKLIKLIGNKDGVLNIGESFTYNCEKTNTQANYTNTANVTGVGVISNGNVNDTDPTQVIVVTPSCTNLTATPSTGTVSFESSLNCSAKYATSYKIEIKDKNGSVIKTISNNSGKYNFTSAGNYTASCYINNKNSTEQACITNIVAKKSLIPKINIDKTDINHNDRDGGANDTQTVYKGDKAIFKITVTNNGNEDLKNVVVTDKKARSCNRISSQTEKLIKLIGNKDGVLNIGESFTYNCEKSNTQENYTNTANVTAIGITSNNAVDDTDPTDIKIVEAVCTDLSIDKTSGEIEFTSNFICAGNNVDTYKILIKNSSGSIIETISSNVGQYNFTNVGDYSVECYINNKTETESVCKKTVTANNILSTTPSIKIDKTDFNDNLDTDDQVGNDTQTVINGDKAVFKITVTNNGNEDLKNVIISDEKAISCNRSFTQTEELIKLIGNKDGIFNIGEEFEYTCEKDNTTEEYINSATVKANSTNDNEEVEDTDTTEVKTGVYDLALIKEVVNKKSFYKKNDIIEFSIAVKNQGTINSTDVIVSDYIPDGLELSDVSWSGSTSMVSRNIGDIQSGDTKTVTITFKVTALSGDITNWAEISSTGDNLIDCDSTPDSDKNNDLYITDFDSDNLNPQGCYKNDGDEDDHDPANITVKEENTVFDLALTKEVTSTSPYNIGDEVEYKILVTNQGDITATNVEIIDYIPENMELVSGNGWSSVVGGKTKNTGITTILSGETKELIIKLKILSGATGTITNWAEIFNSEGGVDCDSEEELEENNNYSDPYTTDYSEVIPNPVGCFKNGDDEDDVDPASITIGNISVGTCEAELTGAQAGQIFETTIGLCKNTGETVVNFLPTTNGSLISYVWGCFDGTTIHTGGSCNASYDSNTSVFDLALTKEVITTSPYNIGDEVEYKILVTNQGNITATNVEVIDYIPENMELVSGNGWSSVVGGKTKNTGITTILSGETKELTIKLKILAGATGTITNWAEIFSSEGGVDCDSYAEVSDANIGSTDPYTTDYSESTPNPVGCYNQDGDEDDVDPASITIGDVPPGTCEAIITGSIGYGLTGIESGLCKNFGETVTLNSFISTVSGRTTSYNWGCTDGTDTYTGGSCSASYTTTGGGSGGSSSQCYNIEKSNDIYTCTVNSTVKTVGIDCYNTGVVTFSKSSTKKSNGVYEAVFSCLPKDIDLDGIDEQPNPRCGVTRASSWNIGESIGLVDPKCKLSLSFPVCGNGKIESGEECEKIDTNNDGVADTFPSNCSSCKLDFKNPGDPDCKDKNSAIYNTPACGIITNPTGGYIEITTVSNFAIGDEQNVFKYNTDKYSFNSDQYSAEYLQLKNIGDEPILLDDDVLCLMDRGDNTGLVKDIVVGDIDPNGNGDNIICDTQIISWLYPGEVKYFRAPLLNDVKGEINGLSSGKTSETTNLVLTIKDSTGTYEWSPILAGNMYVTVAKPTIASQGGGTTYIKDSSKISNINDIAEEVSNNGNGVTIDTDQNNFTATVIGDESDLSNIGTVKNSDIRNEVVEDSTEFSSNATSIVEDSTVSISSRGNGDISDFNSYRGIENVYFAKDKNIDLNTYDFTENKTYIIENGDLTISGDITSSNNSNIAFIVKGGDIIVKSNVDELKGTFIAIEKNSIGGKIKADTSTSNKLTVNGSLYGDLSDLTANRTHISMDSDGNISVGTLVSFGSNILNKPAPLVGQFIGEYMDSQKIAQ